MNTIHDLMCHFNNVSPRIVKITREQMPMKVSLMKDKHDYDVRLNLSGFMFEAKNNTFCGKAW